MAEVRKVIGKVAGSDLGKAGAKLAGKKVGKEVEGEVTKVTSKVAGRKAGEAVGKAVGDATGKAVGSATTYWLSTKAGQASVGEIVGPHPGRAICSFWQGKAETTLRVLALLGSLLALAAATITIGVVKYDTNVQTTNCMSNISQTKNSTELSRTRRDLYGYAGYVIGVTALGILTELMLLGVRWCNFGCLNLAIKGFLVIDITLSSLLAVGHAAGGAVTLYYFLQYWNSSSNGIGLGIAFQVIRYSIAVCAGGCCFSLLLYTILALWSTLFLAKGWNKNVMNYTIQTVCCRCCICCH